MAAPRRPTLTDPEVIDALVRQFAARVLLLRAAFHAGEAGAENPLQVIERDARELSAALKLTPYGRALLMYLFPEEMRHTRDPGAALGLWVAGQIVAMMQSIEGGEPEANIKPKIEAMLADIVARLTGAKY